MSAPGNHFRIKLIAGALAPLMIAGTFQTVYSVVSQRREAVDVLETKAHALTSLLVNVAGPSIAVDDPAGVADGLGYLENDPDFEFALAIAPDGKPIAFRGPPATRAARVAAATLTRQPELTRHDDTLVASYPVIIKGAPIAELVVGLRTASAAARVARLTAWAALIALIGMASAVSVVLALAGKIGRRNREMAKLLSNMEQGFLNMQRDGTLAMERSAVAVRLLGSYQPGQHLWEALAPLDPTTAAWLQLGWTSVLENELPLELTLSQLPTRLMIGERTYRIEYKPSIHDGAVGDTLVVITDTTAELARERAEAAERDLLRMIERMTRDRAGFAEFMEEADKLIQRIAGSDSSVSDVTRRELHTLKGNCAIYGLSQIAEWCHDLEDRIATTSQLDANLVRQIVQGWTELKAKLERVFGQGSLSGADVSAQDLAELRAAITHGASLGMIEQIVRSWSLERTRPRLERFADQAHGLATRLGKPALEVEIADHGVRLDPNKFRPFWTAFAHVVRNAVDHGIEPATERLDAGKPEHGKLSLDTRCEGNSVVIELADDGRGIDWDAMRARAQDAGRPHATHDDLVAAMLSDGITTRAEVTETSGRGVGLAALRQACVELGGKIAVDSQRGQGTRFQFRFDLERKERMTSKLPRITGDLGIPRIA
ncbi:MAG TPA: ATP-binding protein [Kofleriaceae bacterium]|nr:ATP-binding protein [Kofleriaceae bacterium]